MVDRRTDRKIFASRAQFYLACLGYITGYASFVRFPHLCVYGGGAAYLVAYLVTLVIFGIPIHYLELAVGQLTRLGPLHSLAKFCPILKGTGVTIVIVSAIFACSHSVIIAWCLHYFFHSFVNPLPWGSCDNPWNSPECITFVNNSVPDVEYYDANYTNLDTRSYSTRALPSEQYHTNNVLKISNGIDDPGEFNFPLLGFLLLTWMICFAGLSFGVKSIGKAVYVTVSLPYLIMVVLLIRATTLPGAGQGLLYLFTPRWSELLNPGVWSNAFNEHIFSFGIGAGVMITYSSYSSKLNNVYHTTMCFSLVSLVFKVIAGIIQLSFLGALSQSLGLSFSETYGGAKSIFSDIPYLFTIIPLSNLWSLLFFLMVTLLAVNFQFGMLEVVCTTFVDHFHEKLKRGVKWYRPIVAFVVCGISFLFSIPYVTGAGYYLFSFLDTNLVTPLMFAVTFELMAVILGYGSSRLARMLGYTSGIRTYHTYPWIWIFIIPILTSVVTSYNSWNMQTDSGYYVYPFWMTIIKYLLIIFTSIWVLVGFIHEMCKNKGTCKEKFVKACTPTFIPAGMMDSNRRDAIPMMLIHTETAGTAAIVTEPFIVDAEPVSPPPDYTDLSVKPTDEN